MKPNKTTVKNYEKAIEELLKRVEAWARVNFKKGYLVDTISGPNAFVAHRVPKKK